MNEKKVYIPLNLREYELLKLEASRNGMKITGYIKSILPIHENNEKPTLYIPCAITHQQNIARRKVVKLSLTDYEYAQIVAAAGSQLISKYIIRCALQGQNVLRLTIFDEDLDFITDIIEPMYHDIYKALYLYKGSEALDNDLLTKLISEVKELNDQVLHIASQVKKNRQSIRQTRLRELQKRCDYIIKDYSLVSIEGDIL